MSRAGYYAWRTRGESAHRQQDRKLLVQVRKEFRASGGTYGSPRVQRALQARGIAVSRRRVERLMRHAELKARVARVYRSKPGRRRMFKASQPAVAGSGAGAGPDLGERRDVREGRGALALPGHGHGPVLAQAARLARGAREGARADAGGSRPGAEASRARPQLIFHSDRGSEYAGATLGDRLRRLCVRQSMTRGGAPGDNAHAESFFHTLKAELVHGTVFSRTIASCSARCAAGTCASTTSSAFTRSSAIVPPPPTRGGPRRSDARVYKIEGRSQIPKPAKARRPRVFAARCSTDIIGGVREREAGRRRELHETSGAGIR